MTRIRAVGAAVGAVLLLAACGNAPSSFAESATPSASSTTSPSAAAGTPMDADPSGGGIPTTVPPDLPEGQRTPGDVAGAAMYAYAVPTPVDPDTWYRRVAPYLAVDARRDYAYTDPSNIAVHQLLGAAVVTRQTDYLATATQATDAGAYTVQLARDDQGAWKVVAITPPEGAGS